MPNRSVISSVACFACGLLVGYLCHLYSTKQKRNWKKKSKTISRQDTMIAEIDQIYQIVSEIQRQLAHFALTVNEVAEESRLDQVDAVPSQLAVSRSSDDIYYDTWESIENGEGNTVRCLFEQVDRNLEEGSFDRQSLYEKMKRLLSTQANEANFWWRLAKVAHFLSKSDFYLAEENKEAKKNLIYEAFGYAQKALDIDDKNADCHKWYAITIGCLNDYVSTKERITNGAKFKQHLDIAMSLREDDSTLYYLAGRFCVELLSLSWIELKVANTFFGALPQVSHHDALQYFYKAYRLRPNWPENILYMVQMLLALKDHVQAKHYLQQGLAIPVCSLEESATQHKLRQLSKKLV